VVSSKKEEKKNVIVIEYRGSKDTLKGGSLFKAICLKITTKVMEGKTRGKRRLLNAKRAYFPETCEGSFFVGGWRLH